MLLADVGLDIGGQVMVLETVEGPEAKVQGIQHEEEVKLLLWIRLQLVVLMVIEAGVLELAAHSINRLFTDLHVMSLFSHVSAAFTHSLTEVHAFMHYNNNNSILDEHPYRVAVLRDRVHVLHAREECIYREEPNCHQSMPECRGSLILQCGWGTMGVVSGGLLLWAVEH